MNLKEVYAQVKITKRKEPSQFEIATKGIIKKALTEYAYTVNASSGWNSKSYDVDPKVWEELQKELKDYGRVDGIPSIPKEANNELYCNCVNPVLTDAQAGGSTYKIHSLSNKGCGKEFI